MTTHGDAGDPFDIAGIWRPPEFSIESLPISSELFREPALDLEALRLDNPYAPQQDLNDELHLPELEVLEHSLPEESIKPLELDPSFQSDELSPTAQSTHNVWDDELDFHSKQKAHRFFSWEAFEAQCDEVPGPIYLSEAGASTFDALLDDLDHQTLETPQKSTVVLRTNVLLDSLFALALGRSSALFQFDYSSGQFHTVAKPGRMTGLSEGATSCASEPFLECGNGVKVLRSYVERTFEGTAVVPARVALASAISTILTAMESCLQVRFYESLLQLHQLFELPFRIVASLCAMTVALQNAKSNTKMIETLYEHIEAAGQEDGRIGAIEGHVLDKVAGAWLQQVGEWVGLCALPSIGRDFEADFFVDRRTATDSNDEKSSEEQYYYEPENMPTFMTAADGELIFELGKAMQFLQKHHPNHMLCLTEHERSPAPSLQWHWRWEDLDRVVAKAEAYEDALRQAIGGTSLIVGTNAAESTQEPEPASENESHNSPAIFDFAFEDDVREFESAPSGASLIQGTDELRIAVDKLLLVDVERPTNEDAPTFEPPLDISPRLSFMPILKARARVVNSTTLRLFFNEHGLRRHLNLQQQYHLLGDGVFVSRLSSALFSPDLKTAERRKGVIRTGAVMGLRLGSRKTWPPASSELQLALAGILSECYNSSATDRSHAARPSSSHDLRQPDDLPGKLSFSVRQLPDSEIDKVMDANSLYALDFLRLQYSPPSPIDLVITGPIMEKYDHVFKSLLRLMRMLFVLNHLHRNVSNPKSRKFRIEAIHFITTITAYFFDTGIHDKWQAFTKILNRVEEDLVKGEYACLDDTASNGLASIRQAHEHCLDRIMFTLFLRKRHEKVMQLLEEIFGYVLQFSTHHESSEFDVSSVYQQFHEKVKLFLVVCRGLSGRRSKGSSAAADGDEDDIERLLVVMGMSGYYDDEVLG